jgi:hypothetical protein
MASTTTTPVSEFEKEKQLFNAMESERSNFKNKKEFSKALQNAMNKVNDVSHDEEEYAKNNPCDLNKEMTRLAYVYEPPTGEPNRVIAISMTYTNSGNVSYGASIFRREKNETFGRQQKSNIRNTAETRHKQSPNTFQLNLKQIKCDARKRLNFNDIKKYVRKHIGSNGVKGPRITNHEAVIDASTSN